MFANIYASVLFAIPALGGACLCDPWPRKGIDGERALEFLTAGQGLSKITAERNFQAPPPPQLLCPILRLHKASRLGQKPTYKMLSKQWKVSLTRSSDHTSHILAAVLANAEKILFPSTLLVFFFLLMDCDSFIPFFKAGY